MIVRDAQAGEAPALLSISLECFGVNAWTRNDFEAVERAGFARWVLLAEVEGSGQATPQRLPLAGYIVLEFTGQTVEIQALAVRENYRRRRIGAALLRRGIEQACSRGATEAFLEVRSSNTAAQGFYRHHGFQEYGRRSQYYRDPEEDAVLMRWQRDTASGL